MPNPISEIKLLQRQLLCLGYSLTMNGVYDAATVSAVKAFQNIKDLTQDGIAGPITSAAINALAPVGVDISHNDGAIDWPNISPRVKFVYAKASQGAGFKDPLFIANIAHAKAAGLFYGAYHFLTAADSAQVQAANFLSACAAALIDFSAPGFLPVMVDVEDQVPASLNVLITGNKPAFIQKVKDFIAIVQQASGRRMVVYSYKDFFASYLNNSVFDADLWLASYQAASPGLPEGYTKLKLWQFAESLYPAGFPSCDVDIFMGTWEELGAWAKKAAGFSGSSS